MTLFKFIALFAFLSNNGLTLGNISVCLEGDFYCRTSKECIPAKLRCDGVLNCHFGEDEKGCSCVSWCDKSRRCVLRRERCNGIFDCLDKSDEQNCTEINCGHDRFACSVNGATQCLDTSLRCDLQSDCDDGSDEKSCLKNSAVKEQLTTGNNGCEGKPFCPVISTSEEIKNCPFSSQFASTFRLRFDTIQRSIRKCDTIIDCPMGEDEMNCPDLASETVCSPEDGFFLCANGRECLPSSRICDGFPQCSDGSDEFVSNCLRKFNDGQMPDAYRADDKCPFRCRLPTLTSNQTNEKSAVTLPYSRFCIFLDQACDGEQDCPFGDDEDRLAHGCPAFDEIRFAAQKCDSSVLKCDPVSTECVVTPAFGPVCRCKPGFRSTSQSVSRCVDIDECSMGVCEHFCENLLGSFACGCRDGFHLAPGSCQRCESSTFEEEPYFVFSTSSVIYRFDKASQMTRLNLYHSEPGQSRPAWSGSMPFDYARSDDLLIFYNWGAIKAKLGHQNMEPWLFLNVDHDVTWLAYDDLNNNLYFNGVDAKDGGYFWRVFYVGIFREKGQVSSASRSTGVKTVVRNTTAGAATSNLVLFPEMGLMFFTSSHSGRDKLLYCALNGDDLKLATHWNLQNIRSLGVDRSGGFLYVLDAGRPGLAQIPVIAESSPAVVGELMWIEERRSFFGPEPFISFSAGEYDSGLYFLTGEFSYDGLFKTSFQAVNKSSLMAFGASSPAPFSLIPTGTLLLNTSFIRVRPTGPPLQLDVCFYERQHVCDVEHICLPKPPLPGETSAFTRAVCDCPDAEWSPGCTRVELPIRPDFLPPGRPLGALDEFRERQECSDTNLLVVGMSSAKKRSTNAINPLNLDEWSANITDELPANYETDYAALQSSAPLTKSMILSLGIVLFALFFSLN